MTTEQNPEKDKHIGLVQGFSKNTFDLLAHCKSNSLVTI